MLLSVRESSKFTKHSSSYMGSNGVRVAAGMESRELKVKVRTQCCCSQQHKQGLNLRHTLSSSLCSSPGLWSIHLCNEEWRSGLRGPCQPSTSVSVQEAMPLSACSSKKAVTVSLTDCAGHHLISLMTSLPLPFLLIRVHFLSPCPPPPNIWFFNMKPLKWWSWVYWHHH